MYVQVPVLWVVAYYIGGCFWQHKIVFLEFSSHLCGSIFFLRVDKLFLEW